MAFNFPNSPADGAIYAPGAGLPIYTWSAATGAWMRTSGGLSAGVWIGDNPPVNPVQGQLWWRSTDGVTLIYFADGTSSQWVQFNTGPANTVFPVPKFTLFAANGTWTPDPKMVHGVITAKGGGGGGGGGSITTTDVCGCCGGGEGATAIKYFAKAAITLASYAVTVGVGGAAGNPNGGTGGDSAVGSLVTAKGGVGGQRFAPGAGGGSGSVGDIITFGGHGEIGSSASTASSTSATGGGGGGTGGATGVFNGTGGSYTTGGAGAASSGGGGGGATSYAAGPGPITGGGGGSGIVSIVEYCTL